VCTGNSLLPPTSFLSQALQDRLCEKFHTITTIDKLSTVLACWPHLEQYKADLFQHCQEALKGLDALRKEARGEIKHEEKGSGLKLRIKLPQPPPSITPSKTRRDELDGRGSPIGEWPKKWRRGGQGG